MATTPAKTVPRTVVNSNVPINPAIKSGSLTADQFIKWMDKSFPGQGVMGQFWLRTVFIPTLTLIKRYDPMLLDAIDYNAKEGAIGVQDSKGVLHVYPLTGVSDPSIGERINDLIHGVEQLPVIKQAIDTGEFLAKLGEFIFNPVRMGELVIGVILVGVGVNAILNNPGGKAAGAVPVGKAVKAVRMTRGAA